MSYFGQAGVFLIQVLFTLYITVVMIRFLLQLVRADFYNPLSQFVVKVTAPPLKYLRSIIPGFKGIDFASIVLMLLLQFTQLWLITLILDVKVNLIGLSILSIAEIIGLGLNVFLFTIFVQIIISWINPGVYNPVVSLLYQLNEPLMRPARKLLPPVSGIDLSPLLVIIALQLAKMLLVSPIRDMAGGRFLM